MRGGAGAERVGAGPAGPACINVFGYVDVFWHNPRLFHMHQRIMIRRSPAKTRQGNPSSWRASAGVGMLCACAGASRPRPLVSGSRPSSSASIHSLPAGTVPTSSTFLLLHHFYGRVSAQRKPPGSNSRGVPIFYDLGFSQRTHTLRCCRMQMTSVLVVVQTRHENPSSCSASASRAACCM